MITSPPLDARSWRRLEVLGRWGVLLLGMAGCARVPAASNPVPPPARAQSAGEIGSGRELVRAMHDRYATTWYRTVTFAQRTTISLPSGTLVQHWLEAAKIPGRLRIDIDTATRSGVIYAGDSVYRFASGRLVARNASRNDLLVLGFDVYRQLVDSTVAVLQREGFDLARFHVDEWEGTPVYVVGALAGDTLSKQFWVERDRLLFLRLLEPQRASDGVHHSDIRFLKYAKYGGGWVAEDVVMYTDGRQRLHEEYAGVRVDVPLADAIFDPQQWASAEPWYRS